MNVIDICNTNVYTLLHKEAKAFFYIPPFQRPYTWRSEEWAELYSDITENERGYFIGSMIMLSDPTNVRVGGIKNYMIIDGQQRLTTLSILLCAVYSCFEDYKDNLDEDSDYKYKTIQYMIVLNPEGAWMPRIILQDVDENNATYCSLLTDLKFKVPSEHVRYAGNRLIYRAFNYFKKVIQNDLEKEKDKAAFLFKIVDLIGYATIANVTVGDISDAIQIFSTLNHRGVPLTSADLIKTTLIQNINEDVTKELYSWNILTNNINEGKEGLTDRFFKSFINSIGPYLQEEYAYEYSLVKSSNIIKEYEKIIKINPRVIYDEMIESSYDFSKIIGMQNTGNKRIDSALKNLSRLDSTTSDVLVLYLFRLQRNNKISFDELAELLEFFVKFYVRRNLTDLPQARGVPKLFKKIIEETLYMEGSSIVGYIIRELTKETASFSEFKQYLEGPIYEDNQGLTRFILASLCESHTSSEYRSPWEVGEDGKPIWTVEHILPQNRNLSPEWVQMIANGDNIVAGNIQSRCVHMLGNLTLSGNNSSLGDMPFINKRDAEKKGVNIGYKNGLWLNKDLKIATEWNEGSIKKRTETLVSDVLSMFCFDSEKTD